MAPTGEPDASKTWPPKPQPALAAGEVDLWWLPASVPMGADRRTRIDQFLRGVLAAYVGQPADQLIFGREAKGKPFLARGPNPDFNLSDTRGGSLLAVSAQPRVGVDLERLDRRPSSLRLAERWFHRQEFEALRGLAAEPLAHAFLRLWTAKEASCKATGTGIYGWLSQWVFDAASETPRMLRLPAEAGEAADWHFLRVEPEAGFTAVVAATGFHPRVRQLHRLGGDQPPSRWGN